MRAVLAAARAFSKPLLSSPTDENSVTKSSILSSASRDAFTATSHVSTMSVGGTGEQSQMMAGEGSPHLRSMKLKSGAEARLL